MLGIKIKRQQLCREQGTGWIESLLVLALQLTHWGLVLGFFPLNQDGDLNKYL